MENDYFSRYVTEGASCEAHVFFGMQGGDSVRPMWDLFGLSFCIMVLTSLIEQSAMFSSFSSTTWYMELL